MFRRPVRSMLASRRAQSSSRVEPLEIRVLPAITASLAGVTLNLQGDQGGNDIQIEQNGADLVITGNNGTLINFNGQSLAQVTITGAQNLRGSFGQGADKIRLEDGLVLNNVTLNLGAGANDLEFQDVTINGTTLVTGGNNSDKVEFDAATLNAITLNLGNGNDEVEFRGSTVNGAVSINTGNGLDSVETELGTGGIANVFLAPVTIKTGNQADSIELRNATFANLTIDAGADSDEIELHTVTINGRLTVNGGSGNDEITLEEVIQTGTGGNQITGLSGKDAVHIKTASFASAVSIDLGSGPLNELEIDDVGFAANVTIVSNGPNDQMRIEQDLARAGLTNFGGNVAITMGPGSSIGLGVVNGASFTQAAGAVTIKGSKPLLQVTLAQTRVAFTQLPVLKNAEFVLV